MSGVLITILSGNYTNWLALRGIMYVVLDSNIWISELGLSSTLGAATRFYLKRNKATLAVPEVVKLESERNLKNRLDEYILSIRKSHSNLLSIFGRLKEVVLPGEKEINELIDSLFSNLNVEYIEIPFSLESARSSFFKTIDKVPPSDKSQQFKDGVLWADCLNLLKEQDVHLVTEDKAFYQDRQYTKGIAKNLEAEVGENSNKLYLYNSLHDLLKTMKSDIKISSRDLLQSFLSKNSESVNRTLERVGFEIGTIKEQVITSYATESPSLLYVEFELLITCNSVIDDGRSNGQLILKGDGQLDLESGSYSELRNYGEEFLYDSAEGSEERTKNTVLFVDSLIIGHKEVKHSVRYKLE